MAIIAEGAEARAGSGKEGAGGRSRGEARNCWRAWRWRTTISNRRGSQKALAMDENSVGGKSVLATIDLLADKDNRVGPESGRRIPHHQALLRTQPAF
jgi:hypothetical protein